MSCDFTRTALHGYLDGELDATGAAEFERHLESCRECTTALGAEESLRSSLQRSGLYENAPVALRKKIRAGLDAATASSAGMRIPTWRLIAVAATVLIVATHKTEKTAKPRATIVRAARKAGRPQSLPRRNPTAVSARKIPKVSCSNPAAAGCSNTQPILYAAKDGSEGTNNDMVMKPRAAIIIKQPKMNETRPMS